MCAYLLLILFSNFNIWVFLKSWLFIFSESLEEQDVLDNSTEQTEDTISDTEQTDQVVEKVSGTEEPQEKQEETENENEETSVNEAKPTVPTADSNPNPELGGDSLMTM